jgi:hypothetical protein
MGDGPHLEDAATFPDAGPREEGPQERVFRTDFRFAAHGDLGLYHSRHRPLGRARPFRPATPATLTFGASPRYGMPSAEGIQDGASAQATPPYPSAATPPAALSVAL